MNREIYKRAIEEKDQFPTSKEAVIDHLRMAMSHAFLFMESVAADNLLIVLANCIEDLNPIVAPIKVIFPDREVPNPEDITNENIVDEEAVPGGTPLASLVTQTSPTRTVILAEEDEEKVPDTALDALISTSQLQSRAKIILARGGITSLRELVNYDSQGLLLLEGCGTDTMQGIVFDMKNHYGVVIEVVAKEKVVKPYTPRGPYKKRS